MPVIRVSACLPGAISKHLHSPPSSSRLEAERRTMHELVYMYVQYIEHKLEIDDVMEKLGENV